MVDPLEAQSPPAELDEAPHQLPSLPTEIVQRIIQLSLPPTWFFTFRERYDILLNLCGVNKLWATTAQRELVRDVWPSGDFPWTAVKQAGRCAEQVGGVRPSLWLSGDAAHHALRCLNTMSMIKELWVADEDGRVVFDWQDMPPVACCEFSTRALSAGADHCAELVLETIALLEFQLVDHTPIKIGFPFLTTLALSLPRSIAELCLVLDNSEVPELSTLSITLGDHDGDITEEGMRALGRSISRLAPQLRSFSFSITDPALRYQLGKGVWRKFTKLEHLVLDNEGPVKTALCSLPASLTSFRLRRPIWSQEVLLGGLLAALRAEATALETLSRLTVALASPPLPGTVEEWELMALCQAQGIELMDAAEAEMGDMVEHFEDSLEFW